MLATPLSATTIVMPSDEALVAKSPVIVEGTVLSSVAVDHDGRIWTETTLQIDKTVKGDAAGTITIREIGGAIDNRITKVFGGPDYKAGEEVLAFLEPHPAGGYRTVDLYIGKFTREQSLDGRKLFTRNDEQENVNLLDSNLEPLNGPHIQRDAAGFESFITETAAGRKAPMNYGVVNPVIDRAPRTRNAGGLTSAPNFELIDEPNVYRWFGFQNGQSASWRTYGTQPGYSGGGVSEVQTGLASWNNAASTDIRYTYGGTGTGTPGGLDRPNGINEVLFNDPLNEISGSWNPSTGGVVGRGGFNGVTFGGAWTSPFAGDADHPQQTYTSTYNITEGNLVIQDNVSPTTGLSSSRLAEIIAHEFGHTLGLGHSTVSGSLMWPTVTGQGPALRSDDLRAVQWLYPDGTATNPGGGGGGTTGVPSAPTGLTATPSGTTVTLRWTDNATNESGQSVYYAIGSGAFQKVGDLGANVTTITLTGFSSGIYRLYVVAFNSAGASGQSNIASVTIGNSLTAAFTATPSSGVAGETNFAFTDASSGSITSWAWAFGDGATASGSSVSHVYAAAGVYTVTLTVSGAAGTSSAQKTVTVSGPSIPMKAQFTWSPTNPVAGHDVGFSDQSTGNLTAWVWNFGDGGISSEQNPVHRYNTAGTYTVTLTIYRNAEALATTRTISVISGNPATPAIVASFDASTVNASVGQDVAFTDRSSGSPTSWTWAFGDGSFSSQQNPSHAYAAAGSYTVTLTAVSATSSAAAMKTITVSTANVPYRSLISVTTQTNGVGGSLWRTELSLFNAGEQAVNINLSFIPGAGGEVLKRALVLNPRQSKTYANALLDIFSLSSGAGALAIEGTSASTSANLKVSSRTFTNGTSGTYGQAVPDVVSADLQQTLYMTGLTADTSYRTNIGLVNRSEAAVSATMMLLDANGVTLGTTQVTVPAGSFQQAALSGFFPQAGVAPQTDMTLRVSAAAANALSVYASKIDNRTQDPIFLQGIPAVSNGRLVLPAVGRAPGANGTFWRSDVTFHNPTGSTLTLGLRYLPAGLDNRNVQARNLAVQAGKTTTLADILDWFGGLSAGSGALEITWSGGGNGPIVSSRTYTTAANGGTYGQSIDAVSTFGNDRYVPGLRSDASFRSNAGFVNPSNDTIGISLTLLAENGQQLATGFVSLPPQSQAQTSIAALFPNVNVATLGSVTLQAHTDNPGGLFVYGSLVDNDSGDPVFYAAK
ncbi:MAG: PKD domain-containing protein [Acidobacteria bacterium]|nr:PKD domain-containing protein [Acidobacteriota bacterium]